MIEALLIDKTLITNRKSQDRVTFANFGLATFLGYELGNI
jgi:hypothetical protein